MRDAIAATVIVLYLVLLSWAVFFSSGESTTSPATGGSANQTTESINKVTSELLTSFTSITAVVVAFYFGSVTMTRSHATGRSQARPRLPRTRPRRMRSRTPTAGTVTAGSFDGKLRPRLGHRVFFRKYLHAFIQAGMSGSTIVMPGPRSHVLGGV